MRRKTPEDYHKLAEKRGFRWIGPEVPNTATKTGWECGEGHQWEAVYGSIQNGSGCPFCALGKRAERLRNTPADYHALALERGFRWIGPEVPNAGTKTGWECEAGHRWEARYNDILRGSGCPYCAGLAPKTPNDYLALAEQRGFRWIGPEVPNTSTKTGWECEEGHHWEATYSNVRKGTGCPFCYGNIPKTPADYHALAEQQGFCWIGPKVPDIHTKTGWECEEGHRWEARYSDVERGSGCPFCAGKAPKTPTDYHKLAEERGFRWLGPEVPNIQTKTWWECAEGHRWEARHGSIARGSGCPYCYGNVPKAPDDYHALAEERGFRWLGPEVPNIQTKTWWECAEGHRWESRYNDIQSRYGCPFCAGVIPKTPDDYHTLAKERGFRWIGSEAPPTHDKTVWECEQGHQWEAPYHDIQQGNGCPVCANRVPKTPVDYRTLAELRGFRWLGPEAPDTTAKTWWECEEGHRWETDYQHIQAGRGCPFCAGLAPKTPEDYRALAEARGFLWIGPEAPTTKDKTGWQCEQGHQWEAAYHSIQQGNGCPMCVDMVHGAQVSGLQRDLCAMLSGELNKPFGRRNIDVALDVGGTAIAVEYDAWYWHAGREENDAQRDREMIAAGWRILRVRSNEQLPTRQQLDDAIACLLAGEDQVEIVLDDWGKGNTRFEADDTPQD